MVAGVPASNEPDVAEAIAPSNSTAALAESVALQSKMKTVVRPDRCTQDISEDDAEDSFGAAADDNAPVSVPRSARERSCEDEDVAQRLEFPARESALEMDERRCSPVEGECADLAGTGERKESTEKIRLEPAAEMPRDKGEDAAAISDVYLLAAVTSPFSRQSGPVDADIALISAVAAAETPKAVVGALSPRPTAEPHTSKICDQPSGAVCGGDCSGSRADGDRGLELSRRGKAKEAVDHFGDHSMLEDNLDHDIREHNFDYSQSKSQVSSKSAEESEVASDKNGKGCDGGAAARGKDTCVLTGIQTFGHEGDVKKKRKKLSLNRQSKSSMIESDPASLSAHELSEDAQLIGPRIKKVGSKYDKKTGSASKRNVNKSSGRVFASATTSVSHENISSADNTAAYSAGKQVAPQNMGKKTVVVISSSDEDEDEGWDRVEEKSTGESQQEARVDEATSGDGNGNTPDEDEDEEKGAVQQAGGNQQEETEHNEPSGDENASQQVPITIDKLTTKIVNKITSACCRGEDCKGCTKGCETDLRGKAIPEAQYQFIFKALCHDAERRREYSMKKLDLSNQSGLGHKGVTDLVNHLLTKRSFLRWIDLNACGLTNEAIPKLIQGVLHTTTIVYVDVRGNILDMQGFNHIKQELDRFDTSREVQIDVLRKRDEGFGGPLFKGHVQQHGGSLFSRGHQDFHDPEQKEEHIDSEEEGSVLEVCLMCAHTNEQACTLTRCVIFHLSSFVHSQSLAQCLCHTHFHAQPTHTRNSVRETNLCTCFVPRETYQQFLVRGPITSKMTFMKVLMTLTEVQMMT